MACLAHMHRLIGCSLLMGRPIQLTAPKTLSHEFMVVSPFQGLLALLVTGSLQSIKMVHYPPFTAEQRLFVYLKKENGEFYPQIKRQFQMKFNRPPPCLKSCFAIHHKIKFTFSAHDRRRVGRTRTTRTVENITMVVGDVMDTPKIGTRKRAPALDISRTTLQRILKQDLSNRAYRITKKHKLLDRDFQSRIDFANTFLSKQNVDPYFEVDFIYWFILKICVFLSSKDIIGIQSKPNEPH